jgi:hypothetical protein
MRPPAYPQHWKSSDFQPGTEHRMRSPGKSLILFAAPLNGPAYAHSGYRIFNIGNNSPVMLLDYIAAIEDAPGIKAHKQLLPMQPGDVAATYADIDALE